MSDLWTAFPETCPQHGRMHFRFETDQWICHGFDGEGCDHAVDAEWIACNYRDFRDWCARHGLPPQ